ncbi:hypothetical protein GO003_018950 [Methylicorpusculum oleiharenae]|uniref:hypothetical protein n=1 Tax=Methylicorpusculum oleiharenae TaxID=1338687 RepID=UPI00135BEC7A|nr:hypothetical protein [Methylicorpusculum oleiharenae]MCD2452466.1 hypothetical protein [Methylicorpusculum oleiharenae]
MELTKAEAKRLEQKARIKRFKKELDEEFRLIGDYGSLAVAHPFIKHYRKLQELAEKDFQNRPRHSKRKLIFEHYLGKGAIVKMPYAVLRYGGFVIVPPKRFSEARRILLHLDR